MKRLIYQVCVGPQQNSRLYKHCISSVKQYCERYDIEHVVQTHPKMWIKPDPFTSNRSENAARMGFLPIYEKENAFDLLPDYDQIAIIDSDIYIRENAPNIFEDLEPEYAMGAVVEKEMPITPAYSSKILNYSYMQYSHLHARIPHKWNHDKVNGFEFMNMGMMVLNKSFIEYLDGSTGKQFITRTEFKDFVDGKGNWKWSTDQTLLNFWIRKRKVPVKHMDWRWNGLYSALLPEKIREAHFVHFFLKDKLPNGGEDVELLMKNI